jgi:hypothetical protein
MSSVKKRERALGSAVGACCETLERRCLLSYGVDRYFGAGGVADVPFKSSADSPAATAALPDGRIYMVSQVGIQFGLARLTFNGQLDPTFGSAVK